MNFTELCSEVYTATNRPDMVQQTKSAVLAATLQMHGTDFYFKDIKTAQVVFDTAGYLQTLDTDTLTRFRSIAYIRRYDPSLYANQINPNAGLLPNLTGVSVDPRLPFFDILTPDDIFDGFSLEKVNVAYQVGNTIMIKSGESFQFALMGWYAHPMLGSSSDNYAAYSSWIATEYPWTIIYAAASIIFQQIGQQETSRKFDHPQNGLIAAHLSALRMSNITAKGY